MTEPRRTPSPPPGEILVQGHDAEGTPRSLRVTHAALLQALCQDGYTPLSLLTLYQWLCFALGAHAANRASITATWTPADRHAIAAFLRREAEGLDASVREEG